MKERYAHKLPIHGSPYFRCSDCFFRFDDTQGIDSCPACDRTFVKGIKREAAKE